MISLRSGEPLVENLSHQTGDLAVAREAGGDELIGGELRDPRAQLDREQPLEPQLLLEPDQPGLDDERVVADVVGDDGDREDREEIHASGDRRRAQELVERPEQVDRERRQPAT